MEFHQLKIDSKDPRKKYTSLKKSFIPFGELDSTYLNDSFNFAYSMTFGNKGQHRGYRSGGKHIRRNGEIFANTFQGKVCEFALYQLLKNDFVINEPDLELYCLGKWDSYDFKIDNKLVSVKSTKSFGQLLLLETKDWTEEGEYIPNNNESYDITIMIRIKEDIESIMKSEKLYYSDNCDKEVLWNILKNKDWIFDLPMYITNDELKYLIKNKYIINQGDLLNGKTKMDANNYYCHIKDMHPIMELKSR